MDWAREFASRYSDPRSNLYERAKGSPGWSYTYPLRAYLTMYDATGDTKWLDCLVVSVELVDPRFYHLDTCFCPLGPGQALHYPAAFDEYARRVLAAPAVREHVVDLQEDRNDERGRGLVALAERRADLVREEVVQDRDRDEYSDHGAEQASAREEPDHVGDRGDVAPPDADCPRPRLETQRTGTEHDLDESQDEQQRAHDDGEDASSRCRGALARAANRDAQGAYRHRRDADPDEGDRAEHADHAPDDRQPRKNRDPRWPVHSSPLSLGRTC